MKMPKSVFFEDGNESGDAPLDCALIAARAGRVITKGIKYPYVQEPDAWSPSADHVCGLWTTNEKDSSDREKSLLWIADVNRQQIIRRTLLSERDNNYGMELKWLNDKTLEVRRMEYDFDEKGSWNETIESRQQYKIQ